MNLKFTCPDCVHVSDPADGDICAPCILEPTHPNYRSNKPEHEDTTREFTCPDCLYWGVSMYESPCSECFPTLTRPKFEPMYKKEENGMIASCLTCAHKELPCSDEPCASCKRGKGYEDKFEPETEKKEEEKMHYSSCLDCVRSGEQHISELCKDCFGTLQHPHFEPKVQAEDKVNHPNHYTTGEIEVIKYIRDKLGCEEFTGYCIGNVMKYISRWRHKDGKQDLEKAKVYLQWAIESANRELEGKKNGTGEGN